MPSIITTDILSIPGFEGVSVPIKKCVAIFGLGFDGNGPLCVLERLEADVVYAFYADPAAFDDYPKIAREKNKELIENALKTFAFPLDSVEKTYRYLSEIIAPCLADSNIVVVPMGPKPHVLACILICMRFNRVACLRVNGIRSEAEDVDTTGDIVATRIHFKR